MERVLPALRTAKQKAVRTRRPLALGRVHVHVVLWACLFVLSHSSSTVSGALEAYKPVEFVPDSDDYQFSHMVVDEASGSMYVGGKNWLYHINADMTLQRVQSTLPDGSECVKPCENFNKILAVIPGDVEQLVTCESLTRKCQLRSLSNISESVEYDQVVVNPETPAVGIYSPSDAFFVAVSPQYTGIDNSLSYITKRQLQPAPFESLIAVDGQSTTAKVHTFQLNFVNGFNRGDFTYFITNQQQLVQSPPDPPADHPYVSKVSRVCHNSDTFNTFTEVPISCSVNGDSTTYNLIQAIEVSVPGKHLGDSFNNSGNALMYALFAQSEGNSDIPSTESALCIYDVAKLEQKFRDTVELCLTGGPAYESKHVQGSNCLSIASVTPESLDDSLCETTFFKFPSALEPLTAEAVLVLDGAVATSITSGIEEEHTVLFIGTSTGDLLKAHVTNSTHARKYEEVKIGTSQVQQDNFFDATNDELYLLTDQKVVRLAVTNCSQYTTCDECIGVGGALDGDPYCGWCSLEARCSRYQDCGKMNESARWLSYDSEQCIRITDTSLGYSLPNSSPAQEIVVTVSQLPPLTEGSSYKCHFQDFDSEVTIVDGEHIRCSTPPQDEIPTIPAGESAVTVALSIFSTETEVDFIKTDFSFYDCSLITSCTSCMSSPWACDWCIYDNTCTHDNSTCQEGDISLSSDDADAVSKCPFIETPATAIILPVGVERSFMLTARHLPDDRSKVTGYDCVLEYEGKTQITEALYPSPSTIECQGKVFSYATVAKQVEVALSVVWNKNNKVDDDGITVTLYNCSVDRDSCSRCLSPESTPANLQCQWCGTACAVEGSATCSGSGVTPIAQNSTAACDAPKITDITPRSGPQEGQTLVSISGTDLGQVFSDVTSVVIGTFPCSLEGMEDMYNPGRSVSCRTSEGTVGYATATITVQSNGELVQGTGGIEFNYVDPSIDSLTPTRGLAAGGTNVVIEGSHLKTGSSVSAMFGNASCEFGDDEGTNDRVMCRTTQSEPNLSVLLTMYFDGAVRTSQQTFLFLPNPIINDVSTRKTIKAGGSRIEITGTGFSDIQVILMRITVDCDDEDLSAEEPCMSSNATSIICTTPSLPVCNLSANRRRRAAEPTPAIMSFIFDGYNFTYGVPLQYFENPTYDQFADGKQDYAPNVFIKGQNLDAGSTEADVKVIVGDTDGTVESLSDDTLIFRPPATQPALGSGDNVTDTKMPQVVVKHGKLTFTIGRLMYPELKQSGQQMLIIIVSAVAGLILLVILVLLICYSASQKRYKKQLEQVQMEMEHLEKSVKSEATKAFFDIQQDISGIKDQLQDLGGMPFVTEQDYIKNMLFVGLDVQPMSLDPQRPEENLKRAMTDFSKLLNNKDFLLVFIRSLDEDRGLQMRDRNNIASLLTVVMVLEGKLSYLSDVMLTLMSEQITNAADNDRYRQLFRRTESIVEKILANWMALCMYSYLQKHVAYPLYMLYQAIKFQVEKGPIDVITGHAHYSLNYEFLLDEDVQFSELGLEVETSVQESETNNVRVLDVDTITQVKEKVLDAQFRNKPQSERFISSEVDLVLRSGKCGQLVLRDTDNTTEKPNVSRWARVNTIQHYGISDGALVALVNKQDNPNASLATPLDEDTELLPSPTASPKRGPALLLRNNTNVESDLEEGFQFYHISALYEDEAARKRRGRLGKSSDGGGTRVKHRKIREIYLRRLVSTKKSIQTFVDDVLRVMLSVEEERHLPKAIKYLFDFLDRQADRNKLQKDTSEIWKNSCLPLRFWVTSMTHPAYIFDMNQSRTVDACISVLTQMMDNACKGIVPKYNFETSPSRVLYASELPGYIEKIHRFYNDIKDQPRVKLEEVDDEFQSVCKTFQGTFSNIATLHQLYQFANRKNDVLVEALEEDEQCQRANMGYKLEQVGAILAQGED